MADVLGWLAAGMSHAEILADYPELREDDIRACLAYAADRTDGMKLLFDADLSFKLCSLLDDLFPGSSQLRLVGLADAGDRSVWEYAKAHGFVLVSLDGDFADMAALMGPPPKVIWVRCGTSRLQSWRHCSVGMPRQFLHSSERKTPPVLRFINGVRDAWRLSTFSDVIGARCWR